MPKDDAYKEFDWLQGGPHLEVGFLTELKIPREEFLSHFLSMLGQTTPKVEIVSTRTEMDEAKKDFLSGHPWDDEDEDSFIVHEWNALAHVQFGVSRESLIKIFQISDVLV